MRLSTVDYPNYFHKIFTSCYIAYVVHIWCESGSAIAHIIQMNASSTYCSSSWQLKGKLCLYQKSYEVPYFNVLFWFKGGFGADKTIWLWNQNGWSWRGFLDWGWYHKHLLSHELLHLYILQVVFIWGQGSSGPPSASSASTLEILPGEKVNKTFTPWCSDSCWVRKKATGN